MSAGGQATKTSPTTAGRAADARAADARADSAAGIPGPTTGTAGPASKGGTTEAGADPAAVPTGRVRAASPESSADTRLGRAADTYAAAAQVDADSGSAEIKTGPDAETAAPAGAVTPDAADGKTTDSKTVDGETADGSTVDGKTADGSTVDGKAVDGSSGEGSSGEGTSGKVKAPGVGASEAGSAEKVTAVVSAPSAAAVAAASKGRTSRVLRRANPVRVARSTARSTSAWAKRPSGRLILPAVIAVLLLAAAGTAGAYLVPQALQSVPSPTATPGFGLDPAASGGAVPPSMGDVPGLPGSPSAPIAGGTLPATTPPIAGVGGARPADALATWAQQAGTRAGIPVVAVQAYGYAELVVGRTTPSCHLTWTTIAAIAKVESAHGSANGAVLSVDGSVSPPIYGLPLDGKGGRQLIQDTDRGALDGDAQFDRALGPLQFIPRTWTEISAGNGVDADNNGISDPNDIDDASLAAAKYLCQNGRDLSKADAWWDAILSYNAVRPYAQKVFEAANDYGQRSRV